ncbi:MAG: hypothetical protein AUK47_20005 [Deltaproteobacteria bacterium CG2_30_63_29]|nr:MAG: hypothetical protein AUK47_20005 [Deltaproteobacteria bacterium CG2_30_63_29]
MKFVKSLVLVLALAFAGTSLVVMTTGCDKKTEAKKDEKKVDEKKVDEAAPAGEKAAVGDEAAPAGDEAAPAGDEAAPAGDKAAAGDEPADKAGEGAEVAAGAAWGADCTSFFTEVEALCKDIDATNVAAKASCDAWVGGINTMKTNVPAGAPAEAYAGMEAGCKASLDGAKQAAAAWQAMP